MLSLSELRDNIGKLYGPGKGLTLYNMLEGKIGVRKLFDFNRYNIDYDTTDEYFLLDAVRETGETCGCGRTTTAILYMEALLEAKKKIASGCTQVDIHHLYQDVIGKVCEYIDKRTFFDYKIDQLFHHSGLADDDINVIRPALDGLSHVVNVVRGHHTERFKITSRDGFRVVIPNMDPYYFNKYGDEFDFVDPYIILVDAAPSLKTLIPFLKYANEQSVPLVIISRELTRDTENAIKTNINNGAINCIHLLFPYAGEERLVWMKDLQIMTGAVPIDQYTDLTGRNSVDSLIGKLKKISFGKKNTYFSSLFGNNELCNSIEKKLKNTSIVGMERIMLMNRLSMASNQFNEISVGGISSVDAEYSYNQVADLVILARVSKAGGVVNGGGSIFKGIMEDVDMDNGVKNVFRAPYATLKVYDKSDILDSSTAIKTAVSKALTNAVMAISEKIKVR